VNLWTLVGVAILLLLNAWAFGDIEDLGIVEVVIKRIDQFLALLALFWCGFHVFLLG
jgi:hypothetical protein